MALACPCGSGVPYSECCRPLLRGEREAASASALMRSRYTAYVRRDEGYLLRTWHPSTRPPSLDLEDVQWRGLDLHGATAGGEDDSTGTVTFTALFDDDSGAPGSMHESSRFVSEAGRWYYVDGDVR
ncbi:YchJ family protein [Demequina aestuarii]|uniref:YchJ family protein n=1 Tax=Demequina aestuarii TaxID=327095 RepID=UPI0007853736|nr:YchJ family protein [Demequina aestuarii]